MVPVVLTDPYTGRAHHGIARVDTGADRTVVALDVLHRMGTPPRGTVTLIGVTGTPEEKPVYLLTVTVPGAGTVGPTEVVGDDMAGIGYDALIGTDLLSTGVLIYDGMSGQYELFLGCTSAHRIGAAKTLVLAGLAGAGAAGLVWTLGTGKSPRLTARSAMPRNER